MSDPVQPDAPPPYKGSDAAPFIYFDFAPFFGVLCGMIQVELAARALVPGNPSVGLENVATGHLRCSPAAARDLMNTLEQALKMLESGTQEPTATASKLN